MRTNENIKRAEFRRAIQESGLFEEASEAMFFVNNISKDDLEHLCIYFSEKQIYLEFWTRNDILAVSSENFLKMSPDYIKKFILFNLNFFTDGSIVFQGIKNV